MIGFVTLLVALCAQIALLIARVRTKSRQPSLTLWIRIAALAAFTLLLVSGVYWRGFRWTGLLFLLAVSVILSVLRGIRRPKTQRLFTVRAAVLSCVCGCFLVTLCVLPGILFPQLRQVESTGPLGVDTQSVTFVDASRVDPYSKTGENRKLTVQFWYPSDANSTAIYPLVVFSHGAFGFRGSNLSTFANLASNGYVVCSIDHSHHSFFARHTDGSVTPVDPSFLNDAVQITNNAYDEQTVYDKTHEWLSLRAGDMRFVLDMILDHNGGLVPEAITSRIDRDAIGLFGHSLGGATAALLGRERADVDAVAVLDGTMFGEQIAFESGHAVLNGAAYPVPLLNLYNDSHYAQARELGTAYDNLSASANASEAYDIVIRGSGHLNFTDLPLFSPALARLLGIGQADSRYCIETMNRIVLEFFNHTLKGTDTPRFLPEY